MDHKRLIGAVTRKGVGNDLCGQIGVGRARPLRSVGHVLGEFAIFFADMFVADNPRNLSGRHFRPEFPGKGGNPPPPGARRASRLFRLRSGREIGQD